MKYILLILCCLFVSHIISGQKQVTITITASNNLNIRSLKFSFVDGFKENDINPEFTEKSAIIKIPNVTDDILFWIYSPKDHTTLWTKGFVINKGNVMIDFTSIDIEGNPINYCKVKNAIEYNKLNGYEKFQEFLRPEYVLSRKSYKDTISSPDSLSNARWELGLTILKKKIKFVERNSNLYFSLLVFRDEILPSFIMLNSDTLQNVFQKFSQKIKNSVRGREVFNRLKERIATQVSEFAPDFESFDTHHNRISLRKYHGKFVLLDFWASWCGPCLEKIPMLKKLKSNYPDEIEIISITYDDDSTAFSQAVDRFDMNWTHIYGDKELIEKYGRTPIPALYLLDKTGRVLFNSFQRNVNELPEAIKQWIH